MQHNRRDGDLLFYCGRAASREQSDGGLHLVKQQVKLGMKRGHRRKTVLQEDFPSPKPPQFSTGSTKREKGRGKEGVFPASAIADPRKATATHPALPFP